MVVQHNFLFFCYLCYLHLHDCHCPVAICVLAVGKCCCHCESCFLGNWSNGYPAVSGSPGYWCITIVWRNGKCLGVGFLSLMYCYFVLYVCWYCCAVSTRPEMHVRVVTRLSLDWERELDFSVLMLMILYLPFTTLRCGGYILPPFWLLCSLATGTIPVLNPILSLLCIPIYLQIHAPVCRSLRHCSALSRGSSFGL